MLLRGKRSKFLSRALLLPPFSASAGFYYFGCAVFVGLLCLGSSLSSAESRVGLWMFARLAMINSLKINFPLKI